MGFFSELFKPSTTLPPKSPKLPRECRCGHAEWMHYRSLKLCNVDGCPCVNPEYYTPSKEESS